MNSIVLSQAKELGIAEDKIQAFFSLMAQAQSIDTKAEYSKPLDISSFTEYQEEGNTIYTYSMIVDFLTDDCKFVSELSKKTYRKCLEPFFEYLNNNNITNPKKADIEDFVVYLRDKKPVINPKKKNASEGTVKKIGVEDSTIKIYLTTVKKFLSWCEEKGLYSVNVASSVVYRADTSKGKHTAFTQTQFADLKTTVNINTITGKRDLAIILLEGKDGLRCIEISRARKGDISKDYKFLTVHGKGTGKNGKERKAQIKDETEQALRSYIAEREKETGKKLSDNDFLFVGHGNKNNGKQIPSKSIGRIVKEHIIEIGFNDSTHTAHSLRSTFATRLLEEGALIKDVQSALGHATPQMTLRYQNEKEAENNPVFDIVEKAL